MDRRYRWTAAFVLAVGAGAVTAQERKPSAQEPSEPVPGAVLAERCYVQLLKPDGRPAAMHQLWELQRDALPVLSRAVRSKDLAVVQAACAVLHDIGTVAEPVRDILVRERRNAKGPRREALEWALHPLEARGFTLTTWQGEILFVDRDGEIVRKLDGFQSAWSVQTLPHARLLVTQASNGGIRELDDQGSELRAFGTKKGQPLRAQRLWNGNTMLADSQRGLREFDASGKLVWQHDENANCGVRLLNGHTLFVTSANKLVEIDPDGKQLRELAIPGQVYGMRQLPGGRTLLASRSGKGVVIIDRAGKVVKDWLQVDNPSDALLLDDGSILICGGTKAAMVGPDGKERWSIARQWVAGVSRGGIF